MAKKSKYLPTKTAQNSYEAQLRKVAKHSAELVNSHIDGAEVSGADEMIKSAKLYSEALTPWATKTAIKMFKSLDKSNARAYKDFSERFGLAYRVELHDVNSDVALKMINEQVGLIKSIPVEAATRAQSYAYEAAINGDRAAYVAEQLQATTDVTLSRATLIARTEIARTNGAINQSRSKNLGVNQYVWRTAQDDRVRESHAELEGTTQSWDNPPQVGDEGSFNPGEVYNCRCYAEPIVSVSNI